MHKTFLDSVWRPFGNGVRGGGTTTKAICRAFSRLPPSSTNLLAPMKSERPWKATPLFPRSKNAGENSIACFSIVPSPTFFTLGVLRCLGDDVQNSFILRHAMTTLLHSPIRLLAVCMTAALLWTGCTKLTPYNGEFFDCECGDMTWASRTLNLRMAEVEALDSTTFRYHVIADLRTQAEVDAREDSRDLVLTLTTAVQGNGAALNLSSGDGRLTLQEVDAPGTGIDWGMAGASLNIAVEEDRHTLALGSLTATLGGNTVSANGNFTFDLPD